MSKRFDARALEDDAPRLPTELASSFEVSMRVHRCRVINSGAIATVEPAATWKSYSWRSLLSRALRACPIVYRAVRSCLMATRKDCWRQVDYVRKLDSRKLAERLNRHSPQE